jgi:hypothetical protein
MSQINTVKDIYERETYRTIRQFKHILDIQSLNVGNVVSTDGTQLIWSAGSSGGGTWGSITGTLSAQTDLQSALDLKANLASPTFTGTVVLPSTTSIGTVSSTEIGYLDNVTSSIQTQLNAKLSSTLPGADTQILFNNAGSLGASANLTWNGTYLLSNIIKSGSGTTMGFGAGDGYWFIDREGLGNSGAMRFSGKLYSVHGDVAAFKFTDFSSTVLTSINTTGQFNITPLTLVSAEATSALNIAQTWNTTGTPTAIKLNVTNTASNTASKMLDVQVGGVSVLATRVDGSTGIGKTSHTTAVDGYAYINMGADFGGIISFNNNGITQNSVVSVLNCDFRPSGSGNYNAMRGLNFTVNNAGTSASNIIRAVYASARNNPASARANTLNGVRGEAISDNTTGGTVVTASGIDAYVGINTAGPTITSAYGVRVDDLANAGTITNTYGMYVGDITVGTQTNQAYSFYASDANARNSFAGQTALPTASALSTPILTTTGTWITGGSATTTKPHVLIEPTGTTSTAWSTSGTGLGINAASGFTGNLIDLQINGSSLFSITGTQITAGVNLAGTNLFATSAGYIRWSARSVMYSPADGNIQLVDNAGTSFNRLQFGGTTSSFPSLKRSGTGLIVRLADDSANADITAAGGTFSNSVALSSGNYLAWASRSQIFSPADGKILLQNTANTDFSLLQFGGTTSSFPALKRSAAELHVKLADDSDYANTRAARLRLYSGTNLVGLFEGGSVRVLSNGTITWANNSVNVNSADTGLSRTSAGVVRVDDGAGTPSTLEVGVLRVDAIRGGTVASPAAFSVQASGTSIGRVQSTGWYFGANTGASAIVHIIGGTTAASTAPLKFTAGTNMTTPEAGAVEFDGTNYFVTSSTTRYTLAKTLTNTATLDFGSTAAGASTDLTITVTGAASGDCVILGVPSGSMPANGSYSAWVSAADTVTVRFSNNDLITAYDPASGTFRVSVLKY